MTTLALVHPTNHLAEALREALETARPEWESLRLLATAEDEVGTLTEARGSAAVIGRWEPETLEGIDVVFFCGADEGIEALLADLPATARAVIVARDTGALPGPALVDGVNTEQAAGQRVVVSPHAAVVHLAHLLHPLRRFGIGRAQATVLQPVSRRLGKPLDDLLGQVRGLLAFRTVGGGRALPRQMAFNVFPHQEDSGELPGQLTAVLGLAESPALQLVEAGLFHGQAASLFFDLDDDPGPDAVSAALASHPVVRVVAADDEAPGTLDASATDEVLVSGVRRLGSGRYALWSVMDNLTRGGGLNALATFRALAG